MSKVDKGTAWNIVGVVPAVGVLVLIRLLDPFEDLEEGLELNLTIRQIDTFKATLRTLTPAFNLIKNKRKLTVMHKTKTKKEMKLTKLFTMSHSNS